MSVQKIKSGTNLSSEDHVVRHIPFPHLKKDSDGNVLGILPQAFQHKFDEEYLSVNWLEYFKSDKNTNLVQTKKSIIEAKKSKSISPKSYLAVGNVGKIKESFLEKGPTKIRIAYAPSRLNPAHSGMYHIPKEDQDMMAMLAEEIFTEMHIVSNIR